ALARLEVGQVQALLGAADVRVARLQHGEEQRLLVAEVVVQHALVGTGARRDAIDARAAQSIAREFLQRRRENAPPVLFRVSPRGAIRPWHRRPWRSFRSWPLRLPGTVPIPPACCSRRRCRRRGTFPGCPAAPWL